MNRFALSDQSQGDAAVEVENRASVRHACLVEATSQPLDAGEAICWGATVRDISTGGLSLSLCFPFKPGTFLAVDLQGVNGFSRTILTRVLHVHDQSDGAWLLGCEFVKSLTGSELDLVI